MILKYTLVWGWCLFFSTVSSAGVHPIMSVSGKVISFDNETVTLYAAGRTLRVKRISVPSHEQIVPGRSITAYVRADEIGLDPSSKNRKISNTSQ